ncbi:MAG TPA: O-methyltransferase [Thermoplasmata archaeon]|nr:O-methyltransferase [Thermoplasmata archaeon]
MSETDERRWAEVDRYITELLVRPDAALDAANSDAEAAGLPSIQVSAAQGALLGLLVRLSGARTVLEIGTLGGFSAIWMARALPPGGRLLSLEIDPKHADVARKNLERAGVADRVEVRVGPALETLRSLANDPRAPFDLVFLDADKVEYADYFSAVLPLSRPGTVIVADNVVRQGTIVDDGAADPRVGGIRRFLERAAATPGLLGTVVQTVGAKGYDGMAVLWVGAGARTETSTRR